MYQSCRRPFSSAVALHELPHALRALARDSAFGLERAFDQRHVGEIERQPFGAEDVLNHRQVLAAALQAVLDERRAAGPGTARRSASTRSFSGNRNVVRRSAPGRSRRSAVTAGVGAGSSKRRRQREQLVDRGRLGRLLGEAVAGGERRHFERADAVDQAIELLAQPRLGAGAAGRVQQDVEARIELGPRPIEVPELQLALALSIVLLRFRDQGLNGIDGRCGARGACDRGAAAAGGGVGSVRTCACLEPPHPATTRRIRRLSATAGRT